MKRFALIAAGSLLFAAATFASTPGSSWMEIGPGGRAAALGEAMTASVQGPTATYWNPAAVGLHGNGVELMHANWWVDGSTSQFIAAGFALKRFNVGVSALHVGIGDLELRDKPSAAPIGTFNSRNYSLGATISGEVLPGLHLGGTVRYLSESIYIYHASGWAFDLGALRTGLVHGMLDLGASVRNLGSIDALQEESSPLPTTVSVGAMVHTGSFGPVKPAVMLDMVQVTSYDPSLRAGLELTLFDHFAARAGYAGGQEASGFTAGFGLTWDRWHFDYGYTPFRENLGTAQRFSVGATW